MRLIASSPESAPSYRSSLPRRGLHVRVRTASCTTCANATAARVRALSTSAGVTPCHTASDAATDVPATAVAAAESDPLRSDGATPTIRPPVARMTGGIHSGHGGSCASFTGAAFPRNGNTPAISPARPRKILASTIKASNHGNELAA